MTADAFLFWFLAAVTMISGLSVIMMTNPIYSALSLAMTMVSVAGLFVTLQAYFLAGVQLIVYAGAVMVLFVMVLMLFDLRHELQAFNRGRFLGGLKVALVAVFTCLVVGSAFQAILASKEVGKDSAALITPAAVDTTRSLSEVLYLNHVLGFEVLGVLLLVIAVGTVALSRSKGGTHAKH